jgi:AcrR family transcriptional regulator
MGLPRIRAANIEEHKEMTRGEILDAAQELFQSAGYQETSLGDVANKVGIGRTTFYEYFTDKEDLLCSLVEATLPQIIEDIIAAVSRNVSPAEQLSDLATRMVEFVATDAMLGRVLHTDASRLSPSAQLRVRATHSEFANEFMRIYMEGVASGTLRPYPPDLAGRFLQELMMSAARAVIALEEPSDRMPEVTASMVDFMLHGLGAR